MEQGISMCWYKLTLVHCTTPYQFIEHWYEQCIFISDLFSSVLDQVKIYYVLTVPDHGLLTVLADAFTLERESIKEDLGKIVIEVDFAEKKCGIYILLMVIVSDYLCHEKCAAVTSHL